MDRWSRRQFVQGVGVAGLGLVAGCERWPGQAQSVKVARVGYLDIGSRTYQQSLREDTFRQALREWGYIERGNLVIEWRFADGNPDRLPALAAELVRSEANVTVAWSDLAIRALKNATSTGPIVMVNSRDPVAAGFVANLARPGGNVTGLSTMRLQLAGKRLELLKETVPGTLRVAALWNAGVADIAAEVSETEAAARTLGVQLQALEVRGDNDFERAFGAAIHERAEALLVLEDYLMTDNTDRIVAFAAQARLPGMSGSRAYPDAGGLMAYGPSRSDQLRRAAYYVDRILKGANPADLPVEQPREFELVINLKTAQALGLTIPEHVLLQATEVIQ
jgi:putative ABC transport system substrate-binding protein